MAVRRVVALGKSLPIQLIFVFLFAILYTTQLPHSLVQFFLAVSLSLKGILMMMLPLIIFSAVFRALAAMPRGGLMMVVFLLTMVCASNYLSTLIAYSIGTFDNFLSQVSFNVSTKPQKELTPLWNFTLHETIVKFVRNDMVLFAAFALGSISALYPIRPLERFADVCHKVAMVFLNRFFIPLVPLFIAGFFMKMQYDNILWKAIAHNSKALGCMILVVAAYLFITYSILARFSLAHMRVYIRNLLPPAMTAFGTMSSAAALPLSIKAAEHNTSDAKLAHIVMPATVNIHLVGDSICIPIMALMIMHAYGMPMPTMAVYTVFALFFVLAKFAVAAVPGGGIIVMVPILERHLGFTPEMTALTTTLYILLDPIITTANVLGNNALCIIMHRIVRMTKCMRAADRATSSSSQ